MTAEMMDVDMMNSAMDNINLSGPQEQQQQTFQSECEGGENMNEFREVPKSEFDDLLTQKISNAVQVISRSRLFDEEKECRMTRFDRKGTTYDAVCDVINNS
jgi:hypothetical protein